MAVIGLAMTAIFVVPSAESKGSAASTVNAARRAREINVRRGRDAEAVANTRATGSNFVTPLMATITVDTTADLPLLSACTVAPADCSLRGAVSFANTNPGTTISVPAGTYQLSIPGGTTEGFNGDNSIGDLDIRADNTVIIGASAATTIIQQTQPNDRVLEVNPDLLADFDFSISNVSISGGRETTAVGGGGIIAGAIGNTTTVTNCTLSGNSATGAGTVGGGGISNIGGSLTVTGSAFTNNSTSASGGGIGYSAGDPFGRTPSTGTLIVSGSTFSGNSANSNASGGGALDLFNINGGSGTYSVTTSSFSNNNAVNASGGAILVESGPLTVTRSSFANNSAGASGGAIASNGSASITFSRLVGNTVPIATNGMTLFRGAGTMTAEDNWWGSNTGPAANDFRAAGGSSITPAAWLQLRHTANPNSICVGGTSTLSADILQRNAGSPLTTELNGLPTFDATFTNHTPALGTVSGATDFVNGQASATFTATAIGPASIGATADNETVDATVTVEANATTDPADQAVCDGGTATFSTTASGPGTITFVWKKGATVLNNGDLGGRVSGADTNTLVISNVQASDAGTYTVEATGSCSTASQSATLTVSDATTATDPADATVCQGASASFSTTAGGTGPFTYAWTVDGSPAGTTSSINVDTTALTVGNHTVEVTVSGTCGSAMQSATLTVQEGTSTTDPADVTVCQGATASFSTTASGTGPFTYAWTVDGSPAGTTSSINVATGSLIVGNHSVEVTVSGACGNAVQSATLTVQETTSTTDPADAIVCQGATANFSTTASGTGPFTYAWTVDGSPAGTTSSINVATSSLSVGNHSVEVTVSGACGNAVQSATLTVQETTSTTDPADVTVCPGGMANFSTTASGTGPFHYAWTVDGVTYNGDSASISVNTTGMSLGAHPVVVTVTGACGSATQSATLNIADSAGPTITLHTQSISLWPPNHDYHTFNVTDFVASASDSCDSTVDISDVRILGVTSDELDDNPSGADGNTLNDIVIAAGCGSVQLRAERDGNLNGRVYTITFIAFDSNGNSTMATAKVTVPKTQFGAPATDNGPQYTVSCP